MDIIPHENAPHSRKPVNVPGTSLPDIQDVLFSFDTDGTIRSVNSFFSARFNRTPDSLVGVNIYDLLASAGLQDIAIHRKKQAGIAISSKQQVSFIDEQDGKSWQNSIYPVMSDGTVSHLIVIAQDVTRMLEAETACRNIQLRLNTTLEKLHIGAWSLDLRNGTISVNDEQARIFGYTTPPEWTLELYLGHILPEDRKRNEQLNREIVANPRDWTNEYRIRRVDGSIRWLQDIGGVEFDDDGNPIQLLGMVRDITEIKATEQKLKDLECQWSLTSDNCRIGMWKIDLKTMILSRNDEHARIYGEDPESRPTWTVPEILDHIFPDDRQLVITITHKAFAENSDYSFDTRILLPDGNIRWVHVVGVFQFDNDGHPLYVLGTTQDITAQKELENRQQLIQEQLLQSQKMDLLGQLAGGIAHDFNNVLAAIQGNTELVLRDILPTDRHRQNLVAIAHAVDRSAEMVRQLLAFARKQPTFPKTIELDLELEKIYLLLRKLIRENISLRWQLNCPHTCVMLDPSNLVQIVTNLCVNARDAIEGYGCITLNTGIVNAENCEELVRVACDPAGEYIRIRISDTGSGISDQAFPHIFEPFFTTKGVGKGTGLGLSMVYGLVKQNQGHISCESCPGKGTTFDLFFPIIPGKELADDEREPQLETGGQEERSVLIVEDEPDILKIMSGILEQEGFRVLIADNAEDAIELVQELAQKIALTVSDLILPGMNGIEMSERLLKLYPDMKFLFITGYSAEPKGEYGQLSNEASFISKPFSVMRFINMVHNAMKTVK